MSADERDYGRQILADSDRSPESTGQLPRSKYSPEARMCARKSLGRINKFYADPENRRRFEEWLEERTAKNGLQRVRSIQARSCA